MRERNQRNFDPGADDVGLALDLPRTIGREEFVIESLARVAADSGAAMRQLVRPDMLFVIARGNEWRAGFQQRDAQSAFAEHLGSGASRRSRANDADIIGFWRTPNLHEPRSSPQKSCRRRSGGIVLPSTYQRKFSRY